ncbi:MAG: hypothetical protein ACR2PM_05040 [Hyphomicrobiales bacterium]
MTGHNTMKWLIYGIPAIYLAVCAHSIWIIFTASDGLAGLWALFLAWPWGFIPGYMSSDGFLGNIVKICLGFALNAAIIAFALSLLVRVFRAVVRRFAAGPAK